MKPVSSPQLTTRMQPGLGRSVEPAQRAGPEGTWGVDARRDDAGQGLRVGRGLHRMGLPPLSHGSRAMILVLERP
jgi:hypothetical protein